jgi:hypothetical protein
MVTSLLDIYGGLTLTLRFVVWHGLRFIRRKIILFSIAVIVHCLSFMWCSFELHHLLLIENKLIVVGTSVPIILVGHTRQEPLMWSTEKLFSYLNTSETFVKKLNLMKSIRKEM